MIYIPFLLLHKRRNGSFGFLVAATSEVALVTTVASQHPLNQKHQRHRRLHDPSRAMVRYHHQTL